MMFKKELNIKLIIYSLCALATNTIVHSQNSEKAHTSFLSMKLDTISGLESNLDLEKIKKNASFSFYDLSQTLDDLNILTFQIDADELNKKVFSNFNIVENTHLDYTEYLRGCGPLDDGITKTFNSGELMLSNIIDNFVNTYLLKNLIFRN